VRNGRASLHGNSSCIGCSPNPNFVGTYTCFDCGQEGWADIGDKGQVDADELAEYDIPVDLQSIIDFPDPEDPYVDPVTDIDYDNYSEYLIGEDSSQKPGVLALKTRTALGDTFTFDLDASPAVAAQLWAVKDTLFAQNANPGISAAQMPLDPVGQDALPVETDPIFNPSISSDRTFMLVAADPAEGVFILYKEVTTFDDHAGLFTDHPRQVHGMVYAAAGADMSAIELDVDLDGANIDGGAENYSAHLLNADSNKLIRKVVSALWNESQGICGDPCYSTTNPPGVGTDVFPACLKLDEISSSGTQTGNLNTATNILIAHGVIQTTDALVLDSVKYAARFTFFIDDITGSQVDLDEHIYPIESTFCGSEWYAFPCENNMGLLASDDMDFNSHPHTNKVGTFYAGDEMMVEKQLRILGAMVADNWDFENGGNPDLYQAMEISRCLPPYMIGDKLIPFLSTTTFVER
jgi:hypothetical protein